MVPDAGPKKRGGAQASPLFQVVLPPLERHVSYRAATGTRCAGSSLEALFVPVPAPESGSNR